MKRKKRIKKRILTAVLACMLGTVFFTPITQVEAAEEKTEEEEIEAEVKAAGSSNIPTVTIKLYNKNGSVYASSGSNGTNAQTVLYQPSSGSFNANDMIVGMSATLNNNTGISGGLYYQVHCHGTGWTYTYPSGLRTEGYYSRDGAMFEPHPWLEAVTFFFAGELSNYYYMNYNAYTTPVNIEAVYPGISNYSPASLAQWEVGRPYWYQWIGIKDDKDIIGSGVVPNGYSRGNGYNFAGTWGMWVPISGIQVEVRPYNLNLKVNPNGGMYKNSTGVTSSTVTSNTEYTIEPPNREGYVFTGWSISQSQIPCSALNGNQLPENNRQGSINGNKLTTGNMDVTLTANWKPVTYTIHFNGNGATSGSTADMNAAFNTNTTLNANGFKKQYSVTYNGNGGTSEKENDTANATFNGWQDNNTMYYKGMYFNYFGFDAPYYINKYSDVRAAFGYNKYAAIGHWYNYIIAQGKENRQSSPEFKIDDYMKYGGSDLQVAFGTNRLAYVSHWMSYGIYEGRTGAATVDTVTSDLYPDKAKVSNLTAVQGEKVTLTADWTPGSVTLPAATRPGYQFAGWYTSANGGTFVGNAGAKYTPTFNGGTLYAHWKANDYQIAFDGNGATSGSMENQKAKYDVPVTLKQNVFERTGYTFTGWNTQPDGTGTAFADQEEVKNLATEKDGIVILYAQWRANTYTIHFEGNGATDGVMEDIPAVYDEDITLPPNVFVRVTEQGESVFTGWNHDSAVYETEFLDQETIRNLTSEDGAVITLYAIWDDCPEIQAVDRYFSLDFAQKGGITEEELLTTASATDREDGILENRTSGQVAVAGIHGSLSLYGYAATDFTEMTESGSVSVTYKAVDSSGNIYLKMVNVYITDTEPVMQTDFCYVRFINEKYYGKEHENGGLHPESVWRNDSEYQNALACVISNLKNSTPEETYRIDGRK